MTAPARRADRRAAGAVAAAVGGVALAVQSRVNGELGTRLADGVLAALISFTGGLVVLAAVVAARPAGRAAARRWAGALRTGALKPWQCLGGAAGASFVSAQGLTASTLGIALFTVAGVGGQVVSSLVVDRSGFGPGEPRPVTPARAVGAALAVVAVGIAVSDRLGVPGQLWLALLPVLTGAALSWAQAANGLVGQHSGDVVFATLVNFGVGAVVLVAVSTAELLTRGLPAAFPTDWHLYLGGLLGIVALSTSVFAVRLIGVLLLGLCAVAGQLVGAVLLDAATRGVPTATLVGVALTLVAAAVAALPPRRHPAHPGWEDAPP
ncbi:DMT family transporter [Actinokineospora bangkokensis]|uniref:EamA-like transporter family protein n=1 Tax=Actinokineospora bangkokensis TaxID=1193682 RepID=A0A1Q9LES9_9PSEU|nr:DMT family transporter [Actinokineospora bangkokensis]OLR90542.1 hypothetical protein BJP25_28340 [Actinokineospora bangkokensis]